MIHSILDNDLYKLTMQNAVCKLYPNVKVRYKFINRGTTYFPESMISELKQSIKDMEDLSLSYTEKLFINKLYFFDTVYQDFLNGFHYDSNEVNITWDDGKLRIDIQGYWYRTILWEVPLMALVSELYFKHTNQKIDWNDMDTRNFKKATEFDTINFNSGGINIADFGTRRRYSYKSQNRLIEEFKKWKFFVGTSNVHFAEKHGIKAIGTHAHEWFMFHAAKYGYHQANSIALGRWVDVYNGDLGIALTDTFTSDSFYKSFGTLYSKLFDGVRHDSGDPISFGIKTEQHYRKLGIDPVSKTIVFSDGLNLDKVMEIENHDWTIKRSYGIGTWLTNDFPNVKPLNIVIKMISTNPNGTEWIDTIKLSDIESKHTGNKKTIQLAKQVLNII